MSIRRSMVLAADGVLIVASTRWPVSAAVSAISTVSRSRRSPITMTAGSSRSDALSAAANDRVWRPTSRCDTTAAWREWTISTGSSMVMMWIGRARVGRRARAAGGGGRVDDLGRVLDGDDVDRAGAVEQVDERRERRGLAVAARAGDHDQALVVLGDLGDRGGQGALDDHW